MPFRTARRTVHAVAEKALEAGLEAGKALETLALGRPLRRGPLVERRSDTVGMSPGQLPPKSADAAPARVTVFRYSLDDVDEAEGLSPAEARARADAPGVTWVNVDGVADTDAVAAFGEAFGLHPLTIEDVARTVGRPKMEVYPERVFVVVRSVRETAASPEDAYCEPGADVDGHTIEQISFVLGPGFVLSFQESEGDVFDSVRRRIRAGGGRIRTMGPDYLLAALLDLVVDHTFVTLERMGDAAETLEAQALDDPEPSVQAAISALRRETAVLRRAVWPLREVFTGLSRDDTPLVQPETRPFLRDAADHLVQAVEVLESLREVLASVADLYLSAVGTRQNEVMKALTVVGAIFLPLTFLTGLYGMNFEFIPELHARYGYFWLLGAMAAITAGTLAYFRHRDWL